MKISKIYVIGIILAASNACSIIASGSNSVSTIAAVINSSFDNSSTSIASLFNDSQIVSAVPFGLGVLEKDSNNVLAFRLSTGKTWIIKGDRIYHFDKDGNYEDCRVRE